MGTFIGYRDGGKTNEEGLMKSLTRTFGGGVPVLANPSSLQVSQRGAGANMSVDVAVGDVHLPIPSGSYSYWGFTDTVTNVAIAAADPTNPRIDVVVAFCDLSILSSANNNNPGALKFSVIAGTPAASPVAKTDSDIQTALGATTPFQRLGHVTVGAGVTSIANANITDARTSLGTLVRAGTNTVDTNSIKPSSVVPSKLTGVKLEGVDGGVSSGAPTAAGNAYRIEAGSTVVTTNANGDFAVNFPVAFSTGLLTVTACDGDDNGNNGMPTFTVISSSSSRSGFAGSSSKASVNIRVNWIAIGW